MKAARHAGAEAIQGKGWLRTHKWLLARRFSQLSILMLFLLGPWLGLWLVKGNLNASLTLDVLPLTDPCVLLQSLLAGHIPEAAAVTGALIVLTFYLLVGGRVYCTWACPVNMVTDAAHWLRETPGYYRCVTTFAHYTLLDSGRDTDARTTHGYAGLGAGEPGLHAAPRPVLRHGPGVDDRTGGVSARPAGQPPPGAVIFARSVLFTVSWQYELPDMRDVDPTGVVGNG